jgi:hypothetical protein
MCLLVEGVGEDDEKAYSLLCDLLLYDTPIPFVYARTMKVLVTMLVVCIMFKSPPSSQFFVIV